MLICLRAGQLNLTATEVCFQLLLTLCGAPHAAVARYSNAFAAGPYAFHVSGEFDRLSCHRCTHPPRRKQFARCCSGAAPVFRISQT